MNKGLPATHGWHMLPPSSGSRFWPNDALVAQLDRALDYESRGREFESSRARHFPSFKVRGPWFK